MNGQNLADGARPPCLRPVGTLAGPGARLGHTAWSPDGESIAASFVDGTVQVWRSPFDQPSHVLAAPAGSIWHIAWSPDGQSLAAGRRGPILRWRLDRPAFGPHGTGALAEPLSIGDGAVSALSWGVRGDRLCAAVREPLGDGFERLALRSYSIEDGREVASVTKEEWAGAWLAVSADHALVGLSLESNLFEVWDLRRLERVGRFSAPYRRPRGIALASDGTLAVGYEDGSVWMWSVPSGQKLRVLQSHEKPIYSLDFSHDRSLLASKSLDGTVRLRLCDDWRKGAILPEPASAFESEICFHPKLLRLATHGSEQTSLRLWDLDLERIRFSGGDELIPVLFFSANATDVHLLVDEELREIQDQLAFARLRDRFELTARMAVRPGDFLPFLNQHRPRIVHFSGHGWKTGVIFVQDDSGEALSLDLKKVEEIFRDTSEHVECVILNACHAIVQARAIARHIRFVVGMSTTISDGAAIAYSKGFYQALGGGFSIEQAHEMGRKQIMIVVGGEEEKIPVLLRRDDIRKAEDLAAKSALTRPEPEAGAASAPL